MPPPAIQTLKTASKMSRDLKRQTLALVRDLHAREHLRLGWYRHFRHGPTESVQHLREQKARHVAALRELLRRRSARPVWYATWFYWTGHLLGQLTRWLPASWAIRLERLLEGRLSMRYDRYRRKLHLAGHLRSMIEAVRLKPFDHPEPGPDVLDTLDAFWQDEQVLRRSSAA